MPTRDAHAERQPAGGLGVSVLAALRAAGTPLTPGQVQEALGSSRARTTVTTILSRPYEKGVVTRTRSGRGFAYLTTEDRVTVLSRFVSQLSDEDEALLRALLEDDDAGGVA
ncbi:BlaI/MecI/CopY family transcriptional regulator [Streptomyces sp. NPDC056544]|uniref:BlaI/MecI/CopY family transcriptional regulator n=1 Tax=unclassified Streptomyces TaxID=2593676 RepID=UPI0036CAFFB4